MLPSSRGLKWCAVATAGLHAACADSARIGNTPAPEWSIGSDPIFSIGAEGSPRAIALDDVGGAVRLSTGVIVVADGGLRSARLSAFSADGAPLGVIGGSGDGPGEFRFITHLEAGPDDSIYAFDQSHQRLTVFTGTGRRARTAQFVPGSGGTGGDGLRVVSRLPDAVWVGRGVESPVWGEPSRILRDTIALGTMDGVLADFQLIARLPGAMSATFERDGRRVLTTPLFTPSARVATWGSCLFAASGEDATISIFASDGAPVATIAGPGAPRPVTQEHADSLLAVRLRGAPAEQEPMARLSVDAVPRTPHLPFYAQMVVDEWGQVWLEEYVPPGDWRPQWYVVSQGGAVLGKVTLPRSMRVFSIGDEGILGTTSGQFDEDIVELLPLVEHPEPVAPLDACASMP
jgi:hypothetical protein